MKVALDATPLTETTGGIRRYTFELAKALAQACPQDEFLLVSDQSYQDPGLAGVRAVRRAARRWWSWRLPRLLASERVDVFHGTDFSAPYWPNRPSVLTLHDLSPWNQWRDRASVRVSRRTPWLLRLGLATMVITPTEAVRKEAIEHFRLPPEEVVAVPEAAAEHFRPVEAPPPDRPYFLMVGALAPRKNLGLAIEAWREVRTHHDVDLRIAGPFADAPASARHSGLTYMGEAPEAGLPRLYTQAAAVLAPSLYEGFGLPLLEAMQCGAAVLASRQAALEEVSGGAALHLDGRDPHAWAEAMMALLSQPQLLRAWKEKGLRRAAQFSWARTAERTRQVYAAAMRRFYG
ncbi:MAG: glycosyltransferase family 4 protein [Acidobacteria bacterium]|nr:glycosyltransferase family 4 protein [Acidobacteriota bacterium]